jgi:hypothetical protein
VDRKRSSVRNEVLFREVNERVEGLREGETFQIVCECRDDECTETIMLTHEEYEALRLDPTTFAVVPGHDREDEAVVQRGERFNTVRKLGVEGRLAERTDPRS